MAATTGRPRFALFAAWALTGLAACSLVRPEEDQPLDKQEQAARMIRDGKHAAAAQEYAQLAADVPADRDNYLLLSAEQWVAAGNLAPAKAALAEVSPDARNKLPAARALVAAEIAYAENDPAGAIHELDAIAVPSVPDQAQNYWWIRGRSAFLTGHPLEGTRALVERERWLSDPVSLRANRDELFSRERAAAEHGNQMTIPPKTDPVVTGWLDLGAVAVALARDPARAAPALDSWRRQFPQHPANDTVLSGAQTQIVTATALPDQIALLLPLSGRSEAVGVAVRDGFVAAYLEQDPSTRPRLKIYDVAAESVSDAYSHAIADGAGFIVGPLTKEDVAAIAPLSAGHTPVLALNFLGDLVAPAQNFYQFALLPEDEARIVARRVITDGKMNGVVIVPAGELGNRVADAFSDELALLGGRVVDSRRYDPAQVDFADTIKQVLQIRSVKGEASTHRSDASFVFMVGSASAARLIMSQLKFHYAGDLPVYATSDSYEPDPSANADLNGMLFPDMPWMVGNDTVTSQIRDGVRAAWPARAARRDRLYAFGFDAYRLLPGLRSNASMASADLLGVTGKLHIDEHNRVRRDLDWAQIRGGVPNAL